ncbi:hypothetical protein [Bacteroides stercorirosoris]|uniref:Uncharacterized protein n=1 Tax=Bacteroides stercorirosoris TaxID=871324 RepID=A0A1M6FIV1_9BACE|nr:hypothetical protein [Bacteroides stercorirosoris]SHI97595.1 hypothetical protein SAMN05444350_11255 [Bacteroides stercorirosoris]
MKVQIEFQESNNRLIGDATFSLSITDVPVLNMNVLNGLYEMVERAYLDYHKMRNKRDMPAEGIEFIRNNPQGIG